MRIRILAILAILGAVAPVGANGRVELNVTPWVAFAPADLRVRATVNQHDENRAIEIIAESDEFYRSSEIQLAGHRAPRTTQIEFRSLPKGEYNVRVVVKGVNGKTVAFSQTTVKIVEATDVQ